MSKSKRPMVYFPFLAALLMLVMGYFLLTPIHKVTAAPQATTWQVDRQDDPLLPVGTLCTPADNDCTLRGAISVAADGDTIELIETGIITLESEIAISKNLTITSASAADHVIDGNGSHVIFEVEVEPFDARVLNLEGLTLQNGFNPSGNGGAITMDEGDLTIRNSIFQNNVADGRGGAISILPTEDHATLVLSNVSFLHNHALTSTLSGGAIYAKAQFVIPVVLEIENSTFDDNVGGSASDGEGGAIVADNTSPAANLDLEIVGSTFVSNSSRYGGAIALRMFGSDPGGLGSLDTIVHSTHFTSNLADQGGAIYLRAVGNRAAASLIISETTFATNTALNQGGAIYHSNEKGGTFSALLSDLEIYKSLFHNNQAVGGLGGAIYQGMTASGVPSDSRATLALLNVTFSGNRVPAAFEGAAIFASTAGLTSTLSVITGTHVTLFGNGVAGSSDIGLTRNDDTQNSLYLKNSILTGSAGESCANSGGTIAGANNLIQDTTCGSGAPLRLGSANGVIPTLADNGGPTLTHGLYSSSNAIDGVPTGECTIGNSSNVVNEDQRGEARPFNTLCDIGAFEVQTATPPPLPAVVGLVASNDGPTLLTNPTILSATISSGMEVSYTWDFGDSNSGAGITTTHTYTAAGIYTATVVASNATNALTATTTVIVDDGKTRTRLPIVSRREVEE